MLYYSYMLASLFEECLCASKAVRSITQALVLLYFIALPRTYGQELAETKAANNEQNNTQGERVVLPKAFAGIALQDTRKSVLEKLSDHALFFSPDEPDLTLLPATKEQIIEVTGKRFVKKALFQFNSKLQLQVITLYLDTKVVDYFSIYSTHEKKYGRAQKISPVLAQWQEEDVMILLEKPLQIKYVYTADAAEPQDAEPIGQQKVQTRIEERNEFLSLF